MMFAHFYGTNDSGYQNQKSGFPDELLRKCNTWDHFPWKTCEKLVKSMPRRAKRYITLAVVQQIIRKCMSLRVKKRGLCVLGDADFWKSSFFKSDKFK